MIATSEPVAKKLKPLTAGDYPRGSRPLPTAGFVEAMKPYLSTESIGPGGKHSIRPAGGTVSQISPLDHILGVRTKGEPRPMSALTPADWVPGTRAHTKDGDAETQARKWVAQTFYGTMLKQMHDSPFKSDLFSGGRGGKAFEPLMDQHMAEHMARGTGSRLVRGIVKQLKGRAARAYAEQKAAEEGKAAEDKNPFFQLNAASGAGGQNDPHNSQQPPKGGGADPSQNARNHVAPGLRG